MLFAYLLQASVLVMSAVLGVSSNPTSEQMTYVKEDQTVIQSDKTVQIMAVDDRSSNLKYVMAILSSSIWSEIKKRSLTINTQHRLNGTAAEKSLDDLSDQELSQLKKACHDGLKCVAVDQLLVLKTVEERLGDGKVSVRTAITKITQVLTQYTTEYHEDVYQYEAVTQFDDQSKVYESVTTIVEDNRELCKIDVTPATEKNRPKKRDGNIDPINHDDAVNYDTVKNYNVNNGTVNNATINIEPHSDRTVDESPESGTQTNNDSYPGLVIVIAPQTEADVGNRDTKKRSLDDRSPMGRTSTARTGTDGQTGNESKATKPLVNDDLRKRSQQNYAQGSKTPDRHNELVASRKPAGQQLMITDGPSPRDRVVSSNGHVADTSTDNGGRGRKDQTDNGADVDKKNVSDHRRSSDSPPDTNAIKQYNVHGEQAQNNNVNVKNGNENGQTGETDCDHDIVSAGSFDDASVHKGYVQNGTLNNGNMVGYNINNGTINSGRISDSSADNGIINVGTVNNGPVNYGTSDAYTNNGNQVAMNSFDVQQYLSSIDKMYSTILERLA